MIMRAKSHLKLKQSAPQLPRKSFDTKKFMELIEEAAWNVIQEYQKGLEPHVIDTTTVPDLVEPDEDPHWSTRLKYTFYKPSDPITQQDINEYEDLYQACIRTLGKKRKKSTTLFCEADWRPEIVRIGEYKLNELIKYNPNVSDVEKDKFILELLRQNLGWFTIPLIAKRILEWKRDGEKEMMERLIAIMKVKNIGKDKARKGSGVAPCDQLYCFIRMFDLMKISSKLSESSASACVQKEVPIKQSTIEKYFNRYLAQFSIFLSEPEITSIIHKSRAASAI